METEKQQGTVVRNRMEVAGHSNSQATFLSLFAWGKAEGKEGDSS